MAIPTETNKELVVIVDNESVEVAISPPVIDSAIVVGQPPPVDGRTLLFDGYEAESMRVRTVSGLSFEIDPVGEVPVQTVDQVIVGSGNPEGAVDGQINDRIYIDSLNKSIYLWFDAGDAYYTDPQVLVGTTLPGGGNDGQIFIDTDDYSIWMWTT